MKKVLVLVIALAFLSGCTTNVSEKEGDLKNSSTVDALTTHKTSVEDVSTILEETEPEYYDPEHQILTKDSISIADSNINDLKDIDLSEVGLKNLKLDDSAQGNIVSADEESQVGVFSDYARYGGKFYHDPYLAVMTDSKVLFKDLISEYGDGCYGQSLNLFDVDGDGLDEIIITQTVGISGGAGSRWARIYKVKDDEICEIFNSEVNKETFDSGFISELKDEFKLEIKNKFTDFKTTLDLRERSKKWNYIGVYFDEDGKALDKYDDPISCDSFYKFTPKDVDGDGVFEIVCLQYVSLNGHTDYIGDAKSTLKFNLETENFEVVDAEFETKIKSVS